MSVIVSVMSEVVLYLKYRIFHVKLLRTVSGVVCLQCGGNCKVIPRHRTAPNGVLLQASWMNLCHKPHRQLLEFAHFKPMNWIYFLVVRLPVSLSCYRWFIQNIFTFWPMGFTRLEVTVFSFCLQLEARSMCWVARGGTACESVGSGHPLPIARLEDRPV